ncbi:unnamed protein product [Gulo gulo]|uniref:Uncharacterized protein n=1 Tax=Gulo gulo TaxID=48420 RepID=A0A9X9M1D4_GULGU|nr:unnamed protein product [Gulo gulo]
MGDRAGTMRDSRGMERTNQGRRWSGRAEQSPSCAKEQGVLP